MLKPTACRVYGNHRLLLLLLLLLFCSPKKHKRRPSVATRRRGPLAFPPPPHPPAAQKHSFVGYVKLAAREGRRGSAVVVVWFFGPNFYAIVIRLDPQSTCFSIFAFCRISDLVGPWQTNPCWQLPMASIGSPLPCLGCPVSLWLALVRLSEAQSPKWANKMAQMKQRRRGERRWLKALPALPQHVQRMAQKCAFFFFTTR